MQFAPPSEVDRRVEIRCTRQDARKDRRPEPLRLWSIIDEAALHRTIGGPAVMREQYEHLLSRSVIPGSAITKPSSCTGASSPESWEKTSTSAAGITALTEDLWQTYLELLDTVARHSR
jgi:Domain of unknown function (DUF5753)